MPKKIPLTEMRDWLQRYESGESELSIGKDAHHDVRTVKRSIDMARREREATTARAELIKDALHRHHQQLLAVINRVLSALVLPPVDLELNRRPDGALAPIPLPEATVRYEPEKGLVLTLNVDESPQMELLREHLKGERLWKSLNEWKTALTQHIQARSALQTLARILLERNTDCEVITDTGKARPEAFIAPFAVRVFYQAALSQVLAFPDQIKLEERLTVSAPYVRLGDGGQVLARAPGSEERCGARMIEVLGELVRSPEAAEAASTCRALETLIPRAKQPFEEISLLGLVLGRCRVCQRLGM